VGTVVAYTCDRCPLAFEVGDYVYWDLTGHCVKAVCGSCGTMHRVECRRDGCQVLALPGPVRNLPLVERDSAWGDGQRYQEYEWPFGEPDWQEVARPPAAPELGELACGRCGAVGFLVSLGQVGDSGAERCPVCKGRLAPAYFDTVN
jgi:hypothetical protein